MPEPSSVPDLFRFTCPHCQKVLKARTAWAGKRGVCPGCSQSFTFPEYKAPSSQSRTAKQLLALIMEDDNVTFSEGESDRLSMLLSQGTCRDFAMARKLLNGRPLSPKQWRRALNSAAARESMRLRIEEQLERLAEIPDDDSDPSLLFASETNPDAWKILSRFLYFLRHDTCDLCRRDLTGLSCMYLTFKAFVEARKVSPERAENWHKICHHHLGM